MIEVAAFNWNPLVITTLLAAGADNEARDNSGMTALMHTAKYNQNLEIATTLLKAGADAKAKDDKGNTVLRYAQENNALAGTEIYQKLEDASK